MQSIAVILSCKPGGRWGWAVSGSVQASGRSRRKQTDKMETRASSRGRFSTRSDDAPNRPRRKICSLVTAPRVAHETVLMFSCRANSLCRFVILQTRKRLFTVDIYWNGVHIEPAWHCGFKLFVFKTPVFVYLAHRLPYLTQCLDNLLLRCPVFLISTAGRIMYFLYPSVDLRPPATNKHLIQEWKL